MEGNGRRGIYGGCTESFYEASAIVGGSLNALTYVLVYFYLAKGYKEERGSIATLSWMLLLAVLLVLCNLAKPSFI